MARVEPPKKTDTCPGCRGERYNTERLEKGARRTPCQYCQGVGKVTNYKYKTLLAYFRSDPGARQRLPNGATLH